LVMKMGMDLVGAIGILVFAFFILICVVGLNIIWTILKTLLFGDKDERVGCLGFLFILFVVYKLLRLWQSFNKS